MRIIRTVAALRAHLAPLRGEPDAVGLVPTMGALHAGHLSLIRAARQTTSTVIVSLFVNPRQFGDAGDLTAYPRTEQADADAAQQAGADVLFVPEVDEVYPPGFATEVRVAGPLTERLEGAHRGAEHFHGVTTVVTKLFTMVQPDVAFFGAKDAQQTLVLRRLVTDLNLPVRIVVGPTVREPDGLARSSRNVRLSAPERRQATAIPQALDAVADLVLAGEQDAAHLSARVQEILAAAGLTAEYAEIVDPDTLLLRPAVDRPSLLALAVPVGPVRLIDNTMLTPQTTMTAAPDDAGALASGTAEPDDALRPLSQKG